MSTNEYQTPDLASILRSLAASSRILSPQPPFLQQHTTLSIPSTQFDGSAETHLDHNLDLEEGEYDPTEYNPNDALLLLLPTSKPHPPTSTATLPATIPRPTPTLLAPSTPPPDPRSITTYPAALRHVTHVVARNEACMARIRKLVASQHQHERQWWDGRQTLIKQQGEREMGRKKVDDVLRSVGGNLPAAVSGPSPADDLAELTRYDKKVHRACVEMVNATRSELQALGVPFFGIRKELVLQEDETDVEADEGRRGREGRKKLREGEVAGLQKRVLELLEDLCQG